MWLIHGIILLGLIIGTITDFKKREVPDFLNYSLMIVGVAIAIVSSLLSGNWVLLLDSVVGLIAGYAFGALMFYTGQWGGGDAKMLMGMGALIGLSVNQLISGQVPLFVTTIITIMFAGSIYGLMFSVYLISKHWKKFKPAFIEKAKSLVKYRMIVIGVVLLLVFLAIIAKQFVYLVFFSMLAIVIFFGFYLFVVGKVIEKTAMIKDMAVEDLTEGEWIAKDVIVKGKRICGPKDLGISKDNIAKLKKLKVKSVVVKEGIPFIPGFLLGYIIIVIFGNWIPRVIGLLV